MDEFNQLSLHTKKELFRMNLNLGISHRNDVLIGFMILNFLAFKAVAQTNCPEVHDEPFHKQIFENDTYRILRISMMPGDTSLFHTHSTPILYLNIKKCRVFIETKNSNRIVELPAGWKGSNFWSSSKQHLHRISPSDGDTLLHFGFQLKSRPTISPSELDSMAIMNEYSVSSYIFNSDQVESTELPVIIYQGYCKLTSGEVKLVGDYILPEQIKTIDTCSSDALAYWISLPEMRVLNIKK